MIHALEKLQTIKEMAEDDRRIIYSSAAANDLLQNYLLAITQKRSNLHPGATLKQNLVNAGLNVILKEEAIENNIVLDINKEIKTITLDSNICYSLISNDIIMFNKDSKNLFIFKTTVEEKLKFIENAIDKHANYKFTIESSLDKKLIDNFILDANTIAVGFEPDVKIFLACIILNSKDIDSQLKYIQIPRINNHLEHVHNIATNIESIIDAGTIPDECSELWMIQDNPSRCETYCSVNDICPYYKIRQRTKQ